jgi:hypothetical protein
VDKSTLGKWGRLVESARFLKSRGSVIQSVDPELILALERMRLAGFSAQEAAAMIRVETKVKSGNLEPAVIFRWGAQAGEMNPGEAVAHALGVIEAAHIALADAAMWSWAYTLSKGDLDKITPMMQDFLATYKGMRERYRPEQGDPPV